ncbi:MAG: radical SAM peptide maturase, partial [Phycisphaerae bacterium]|nr:radical SAM peptide maturase [Phycisphaerae bacterium]
LHCKYCGYLELYDNCTDRHNKKMEYNVACNIINYIFYHARSDARTSYERPIDITFYGGEPLLNMDLIVRVVDLGRKLSSKHLPVTYTVITNGTLLNKYIDYFVTNNFNIVISLDGDYHHSKYRLSNNNKNMHELVEKNALYIKNNYKDFYSNNVTFNVVLHDLNPPNDVIKYYLINFDKIPSFSGLAENGVAEKQKQEFIKMNQINTGVSDYEWDISFPRLPEQRDLVDIIHRTTPFVFQDYNNLIYQEMHKDKYPTATCLPFSIKLFVTADGQLLPCEQVSHSYRLGVVNHAGVEIKFNRIADDYNNFFKKMATQCESCWKIFHCSSCVLKMPNDNHIFNCNDKLDKDGFKQYLLSGINSLESNPKAYSKIMKDVFYLRG